MTQDDSGECSQLTDNLIFLPVVQAKCQSLRGMLRPRRDKATVLKTGLPSLHNDEVEVKQRRRRKRVKGRRWRNVWILLALLAFYASVRRLSKDTPSNETSLDAIVTVAMCGFKANEMVQALRIKGEWKGYIYVLTDTPDQEDSNLATIIDVRNNHPTFLNPQEFNLYKGGLEEYNRELWSKWHKTQIFQLLPKTINTALFMDADMLAQKPLSSGWLQGIEQSIHNPQCELTLNPERWYTRLPILSTRHPSLAGKWNSGMLILKREESADVLEDWSNRLVRPPFMGRDQSKLTESIEKLDTKLCFLPSHWNYLQNQADLMDRIWFTIFRKATFLHIASTKHSRPTEYAIWKEMYEQKCDYNWERYD